MPNFIRKIQYLLIKKDTCVLCSLICAMHIILAPLCFSQKFDTLSCYHITVAVLYIIAIILSSAIPAIFLFTLCYIETIAYSILTLILHGSDAGSYILTLTLLAYLFMISIISRRTAKYTLFPATLTLILILSIQTFDFKVTTNVTPFTNDFYLIHYSVIAGTSIITIIYIAYVIRTKFFRFREKTKVKTNFLNYSATHDALTKIYNRRRASEIISNYTTKSEYTNILFSVCIFDIDDFKKINDHFGHDCGDAALKLLSSLILRSLPENTIFARWGGEEFLIIFVGNTEIAEEALETIRSRVQDYSFRYFNKAIKLTITLGLSHPDKSFNFSKMLIEADKNLMKGKQTGKNRVVSGAAE